MAKGKGLAKQSQQPGVRDEVPTPDSYPCSISDHLTASAQGRFERPKGKDLAMTQ